MHALVVHCKRSTHDVYIGRPSKWGNPFTHLSYGTQAQFVVANRDEAVAKFRDWFMAQPDMVALAKEELKGKVLGCWCAPQACHGDVLAEVANA